MALGDTERVLLLAVSVLCLLLVLNALRPVTVQPLGVPAFFAAWLVVELASYLLVLAVVGLVVLLVLGGVSGLAWIGVGVTFGVIAGLVRMVAVAEQVEALADAALQEWDEVGVGEPHRPYPLRRWLVAMSFGHPEVERVADVAYSEEHGRHRLDVYRRADHPTGCPTLLQVHGGGWVIGDKKQQARPLMNHLAALGWVCFAPNYRLSPRATFPDHLVDVKRAIAWVREHGTEYGADPGFLVITGGSAGGHLAALAALTQNAPEYQPGFEDADTSVQGCVTFYGVYDLHGETGTKASKVRHERLMTKLVLKTREAEAFVKASPLAQVHADVPPFLVIHGRNDSMVPVAEARAFVARLREMSSQPVIYVELPGTQHAFEVFHSIRSGHVVRAVARFVEAVRNNALAR